jgi:hypothetical protein
MPVRHLHAVQHRLHTHAVLACQLLQSIYNTHSMEYYGVITLPRNAHVCLHKVAAAVLRLKFACTQDCARTASVCRRHQLQCTVLGTSSSTQMHTCKKE